MTLSFDRFPCGGMDGPPAVGRVLQGIGIRQYENIVRHRIALVEVTTAGNGNFACTADERQVGPISITHIRSDPVEIFRSARCIEEDGQSHYLVGFHLGGRTVIERLHRRHVTGSGQMYVLDKARPYRATFTEQAERVLLSLPRRLLESRLPDADHYLDMMPSTASGVGRLALDHMHFLLREGHLLNHSEQLHVVEMLIDLIVLSLKSCDPSAEAGAGMSPGSAMLLSRAKAYISRNLDSPELSPASAAAALGLSKRYLHKLFADAGTTFGTWMREERLMQARSVLLDARYNHLTITEIAIRQGFNDIPHFSRQFRARFGLTPRDTRMGAAPRSGAAPTDHNQTGPAMNS